MKLIDLLTELRSRGVVLSARGEHLDYDAPAGALTPDLLAKLKAHKADVLLALEGERLDIPVDPREPLGETAKQWADRMLREAQQRMEGGGA